MRRVRVLNADAKGSAEYRGGDRPLSRRQGEHASTVSRRNDAWVSWEVADWHSRRLLIRPLLFHYTLTPFSAVEDSDVRGTYSMS